MAAHTTAGCVEQYTAAVGHLIRIIRAHSITLNKHSDTRRIPRYVLIHAWTGSTFSGYIS